MSGNIQLNNSNRVEKFKLLCQVSTSKELSSRLVYEPENEFDIYQFSFYE
jgi:hypothetical protein